MNDRTTNFVWTFVGSLIITVGSAIAGIYSFKGEIALVVIGFSLFILGYRVSQMGIHSGESGFLRELIPTDSSDSRKQVLFRTVFLVVGIVGIATGVTLFTQTILDPGRSRAFLSGVVSIFGYMSAHVGINGVGLGESILAVSLFQAEREEKDESTMNESRKQISTKESEAQPSKSRGSLRRWIGLVIGMAITSASLSSGFIWACGSRCVSDSVIWSGARHEVLVLVAAFSAWWGYLVAHYAWTGSFIDKSAHSTDAGEDEPAAGEVENPWLRRAGVMFGVCVLAIGMVIGVVFIRRGNHLVTNMGGVLFLGGYVIGHYVETGKPL